MIETRAHRRLRVENGLHCPIRHFLRTFLVNRFCGSIAVVQDVRCSRGNRTEVTDPAPNGRCRTAMQPEWLALGARAAERKGTTVSKNELLLRERLGATSGPTTKGEKAQIARVLR